MLRYLNQLSGEKLLFFFLFSPSESIVLSEHSPSVLLNALH